MMRCTIRRVPFQAKTRREVDTSVRGFVLADADMAVYHASTRGNHAVPEKEPCDV